MNENKNIHLFEDKRIRTAWNEEEQEWCFSVVDVVSILTDQATPRSASAYWAVLKKRLVEEGAQLLTNCKQLKMTAADGKRYNTDVAKRTLSILPGLLLMLLKNLIKVTRTANCNTQMKIPLVYRWHYKG